MLQYFFKQQLKLHLIMIEINTLVLTYTSAGQARLDEEDSNGCFKNLGAKCRSYKIMKKTTTRRFLAQSSQLRLGPLSAAVSPPVKNMFV